VPSKDGCRFAPASAESQAPFGNVGDVDFTAWCGTTHKLSGHVRIYPGNPVQGVAVGIQGGPFFAGEYDWTDETGHYEFSGVIAGYDYVVKPSRIGYAVEPESIVISSLDAGRDDLDFDLSAELMYTQVSGHVRDKDGNPLEGKQVSVDFHPPWPDAPGQPESEGQACLQASSTTDANGYYLIDVPDGWSVRLYMVETGCAFIPGYRDCEGGRDHADQDFVAYCGDGFNVSGYVLDVSGNPALNVPVVADGGVHSYATVLTDTAGYYEFTNQPSDVEIVVRPSSAYSIPYEGCIFCPSERVFESIERDYADQNFTLSCPRP
jgi:hypothetical protein